MIKYDNINSLDDLQAAVRKLCDDVPAELQDRPEVLRAREWLAGDIGLSWVLASHFGASLASAHEISTRPIHLIASQVANSSSAAPEFWWDLPRKEQRELDRINAARAI